jgi:DNA-binding CsgD family transcriptional regulator
MGPATVAQATTLRLSRLAPSATAVARAVAVLGRHARLDRVAALARTNEGETRTAVDVLTGMEILAPGRPVRFAHPLVQQAIYEDLAPTTRAAAHDRAADLLLAEQAPADEVAAHLLLTDPMGRDEVVETLQAAAAQALVRGTPASAVAYLRRALFEGAAIGTRAALLHEVGRAEALAGDARSADDLEEALRLTADPVLRGRISYELSDVHLMSGRWKERVSLLRQALDDLGDADPDLTARIEAARAATEFNDPQFTSDFEPRLPRLRALIDRDEPGSRLLALVVAGVGASRGMERAEILQLALQGLDGGRLLDDEGSESLMMVQGVTALIFIDELEVAREATKGVLDNARRRGSVTGYGVGCYYQMWIDAQRGSLQNVEVNLRTIVELALEHGLLFGLPSAFLVGADALLERPQLDDVAALVESVELPPALAATTSGAWVIAVRGRLRLMRGERDAAIADLRAAGEILAALEFANPLAAPWRSPLALALGAENEDEARTLVDDELRDATNLGLTRCRGVALRTAGCLEGGSRGMELLDESRRVLEQTDAHLERARTLVELGAARRRANQRVAARDPLRAGLDLAHRCGADRLSERAVEELQLCGARPRRRVLSGPEALTPGEARVARMAAAGMTNREIAQDLFVTAKTVENQLGAVYGKLGVRSRAQLSTALEATESEPAPGK